MQTDLYRFSILVSLALLAFAANSLLCRWALAHYTMDPLLFSEIRLLSGCLMLALLCFIQHRGQNARSHWGGGIALVVYAVFFSLAYTALSTGSGALILFASVQITLIIRIRLQGEHLHWQQIMGMGLALAGLIYLCLPSLSAPPVWAALLMGIAGVAWAAYTAIGQGLQQAPLLSNYRHFLLASLLCLPGLYWADGSRMPLPGIALALASGALASGLGYALWYAVLPGLTRLAAAVLQLCVPLIAALLGILILGEQASFSLLIASSLILGGILLSLWRHHQTRPGQ